VQGVVEGVFSMKKGVLVPARGGTVRWARYSAWLRGSAAVEAIVLAGLVGLPGVACNTQSEGDHAPDTSVDVGGGDTVPVDGAADGFVDGARPPLFGTCVPGSRRCSHDERYVEVCGPDGIWRPWWPCDYLADAGATCTIRSGLYGPARCVDCSASQLEPRCVIRDTGGVNCDIGFPTALWVLGNSFRTSCNGTADAVVASVRSGFSVCPEGGGEVFPSACGRTGSTDWVTCTVPCACEAGVFEVPGTSSLPDGSVEIPYGQCASSGFGRPDAAGDDVTRTTWAELADSLALPDRRCPREDTFLWRFGLCLPVGCGYCTSDEHCGAEERCAVERCASAPDLCAIGAEYASCVPR
jgi:hypothetical protein